jgi:hypothetical protein
LAGIADWLVPGFFEAPEMVKQYEGDYELEEVLFVRPAFKSLAGVATEYAPLVDAFKANIDRVINLGILPILLVYKTYVGHLMVMRTRLELGLKDDDHSKDRTPEFLTLWREKTKRAQDGLVAQHGRFTGMKQMEAGSDVLKDMLRDDKSGVTHSGVEALLSTIITGGYAAYEALAEDLWEAALNKNNDLALSFLTKSGKDLGKGIGMLRTLDLNGHVGTMMRPITSMASIEDIKNAYKLVFGNPAEGCFSDELRRAQELRHVFAHSSGVVDQKFLRNIGSVPCAAEFHDLTRGERIKLTGPIARRHLTDCIDGAVNLIKFVNGWKSPTS